MKIQVLQRVAVVGVLLVYEYSAKLDRVIDGDTIDCVIDLGFDIKYKCRVRLKGIDTPEIRTKDLEEKKRGFAAKERVVELLSVCETFIIKTELDKKGKYGRILGTIFINNEESINQILLLEGHAEVYLK